MLRHARPAVRDFGLGLGHCMGMLLLLLFGLWIAVLGATEANPSKAGMNAERLARIPVRMQAFVERARKRDL
jgi:hypothetical protein